MQADGTHRNGADGNARADEPLNLSVPRAAKKLGIGKTKMWQLVHGEVIESIKIGARRVVPVEAIEAYQQSRRDAS